MGARMQIYRDNTYEKRKRPGDYLHQAFYLLDLYQAGEQRLVMVDPEPGLGPESVIADGVRGADIAPYRFLYAEPEDIHAERFREIAV